MTLLPFWYILFRPLNHLIIVKIGTVDPLNDVTLLIGHLQDHSLYCSMSDDSNLNISLRIRVLLSINALRFEIVELLNFQSMITNS